MMESESLFPCDRRIRVVATIEIPVTVEMESEDDDLIGSGKTIDAVKEALDGTGVEVGFIERWAFDD